MPLSAPVVPIVPPLQASAPVVPLTVKKLVPIVGFETVNMPARSRSSANDEEFVRFRIPVPSICTGLSAVKLFAAAVPPVITIVP